MVSINDIPIDVIRNYIFRYLHGIDALRLMSTCRRAWYIYSTVIDRIRVYAPLKNYVIQTEKRKGTYCKYCGVLVKRRTRHKNRCPQIHIQTGYQYCGCINTYKPHIHHYDCGLYVRSCTACTNSITQNEQSALKVLVGCSICGKTPTGCIRGCFTCLKFTCRTFECPQCKGTHYRCSGNNSCTVVEYRMTQMMQPYCSYYGQKLWGLTYRLGDMNYITFNKDDHVIVISLNPRCYIIVLTIDQQEDQFLLQTIFKRFQCFRAYIYQSTVNSLNDDEHLLYYAINGAWKKEPKD